MILKLKKDMKKQVKRVNKEMEKLGKKFDKKEYDTNVALLKMDQLAYIEKMGGSLPKK